jgi:hypothetical protein
MSEARTADRLDHLERDVGEIKTLLARLEPMIIRIDATLPHLATKAELTGEVGKLSIALADKPGKTYLATAIGILIAAYALGLAGLAALPTVARLLAAL